MSSILQGRDREAKRPGTSDAPDEHQSMHDSGTGETHSHLVSHGDGTHHIEHEDGSRTDHEHIGHALMHLAGKHSEGMHHHTHHDGMGGGHTVHKASHGGEAEGPEEHENLESVKDGMDDFFGGEGEPEEAGTMEHKAGGAKEQKDYD